MESQGQKDLVTLLRTYLLGIYFSCVNKKRKEYIHKCEKCGGQTMYAHRPNPLLYPPQFLCLEDKCLWEMYNDPEISDLKKLIQ